SAVSSTQIKPIVIKRLIRLPVMVRRIGGLIISSLTTHVGFPVISRQLGLRYWVLVLKRLHRSQRVKAVQPLIPENRRSDSGDMLWQQRMYTLCCCLFIFRKAAGGQP